MHFIQKLYIRYGRQTEYNARTASRAQTKVGIVLIYITPAYLFSDSHSSTRLGHASAAHHMEIILSMICYRSYPLIHSHSVRSNNAFIRRMKQFFYALVLTEIAAHQFAVDQFAVNNAWNGHAMMIKHKRSSAHNDNTRGEESVRGVYTDGRQIGIRYQRRWYERIYIDISNE